MKRSEAVATLRLLGALSPERRPNNSMTAMRSWLAVVVRSRVIASTERLTAVEKPMQ